MRRDQFTAEDIRVNKDRYLLTNEHKCESIKQRNQELDKILNWMLAEDLKKQKDNESQATTSKI